MSKNRKAVNTGAGSKPRRRWLNIGPGIVLALALSAFIGAKYINAEIAMRKQPSAPPIVERQIVSSSYEEKSGPTPEVSFIIDRAAKLHITDAQLAGLKALDSKWEKFVSPKMAQAKQAAAKTNEYLAGAENNRRTPVAQIQHAAAPLVAVSGEISSARRNYWSQATNILTPEQRKALQLEREADWALRMKSLSKTPHR